MDRDANKSRVWDTFLPIPEPLGTLYQPELDGEWLAARGMCKSAPAVIRLLYYHVDTLVRNLAGLDWFMFLMHDRGSGVPAAEGDSRAFVHLRFVFKKKVAKPRLPRGWLMTRAMPEADDVVGDVPRLIGYQSECLLRIVRQCRDLEGDDDAKWVRVIKQHLHYFANMVQMRVE